MRQNSRNNGYGCDEDTAADAGLTDWNYISISIHCI